ncbi:MAG: UDP-3-O-acyl-N-acetylglucosamine deacetylase [Gemmataceae bacterium]
MRRYTSRPQRTTVRPVEVDGVGMLSGNPVRVRFVPAPPSTGVVFVRVDLAGRPRVSAHVSQVTGTNRRTTLGRGKVQVTLVEHVLAALAGLRVDNCLIEIDGPEPPGLDGSANRFVQAVIRAGIREQPVRRGVWSVTEPVTVQAGTATLTLHPPTDDLSGRLVMSYFLDYGSWSPIARQVHTQLITPGTFLHELSACRTFLLEEEAEALRRQGIGARTTTADLLVFGRGGPIGNRLRFANEPARHKVLDMVGDLSLLGADLCGHLIAYRSGHPLNVELARELNERMVRTMAHAAVA